MANYHFPPIYRTPQSPIILMYHIRGHLYHAETLQKMSINEVDEELNLLIRLPPPLIPEGSSHPYFVIASNGETYVFRFGDYRAQSLFPQGEILEICQMTIPIILYDGFQEGTVHLIPVNSQSTLSRDEIESQTSSSIEKEPDPLFQDSLERLICRLYNLPFNPKSIILNGKQTRWIDSMEIPKTQIREVTLEPMIQAWCNPSVNKKILTIYDQSDNIYLVEITS